MVLSIVADSFVPDEVGVGGLRISEIEATL